MTAKTRCLSCQVRPADSSTPDGQLCRPCETEAGWENAHSDNAHEVIADGSLTWKQTNYKTKKAFDAWASRERADMKNCWICHPELNEAQRQYTARTGTSRVGMRMNVRRSQPAQEKAAKVVMAIEGTGHGSAKVSTRKGVTTLRGKVGEIEITCVWEGRSFVTGTFNGRKIRNVSDALQAIAA